MVNSALITKLRMERTKLLLLENKQRKAKKIMDEALSEERKLKREIRDLKINTSNSFIRKLRSKKLDPATRENIKRGAKKAGILFKKFQKFANRVG